jgi:transcriptional regulator with XRE-family HTH domain
LDDIARLIGSRIADLRKRLGMTQGELGKAIGDVTQTTIYRIEKGQSWPQQDNLEAILRALKVSPREFFADAAVTETATGPKAELLALIRSVDDEAELEVLLSSCRSLLSAIRGATQSGERRRKPKQVP